MLLFKRGTRKIIPGIVILGINTKCILQLISKNDNFWKDGGKQRRARALSLDFPLFRPLVEIL